MYQKRLIILFWISIIVIICIRYTLSVPPKIEKSELVAAQVQITTFPSLKQDKQIIKVRVISTSDLNVLIPDQNIQILTSLYNTYERGDVLKIEGKINSSGFIFYPKINKIASQSNIIIKLIDQFRQSIESNIQKYIPEPHATIVEGMLLGTSRALPTEIDQQFKTTITTHMLVVSGFNITLITLLVMNLAGFVHRKVAIVSAILATFLFVILAGANPPAVRAGIMAFIVLVGQLLGKQVETVYTLLLTAAVMLLIDPQLFNSLSFQLSFTATLGITTLPNYLTRMIDSFCEHIKYIIKKLESNLLNSLKVKLVSNQFIVTSANYLKGELSSTLGAQLAVTPLLTKTFGTLSLIGPLANIMVAWVVPIIMILGLFVGVVGYFSETLSYIAAFLTVIFTAYFLNVVALLSSVPYANLQGIQLNWAIVGAYYCVIGILIAKYQEHKK